MRLPQTFMLHQRRVWFLLVSRKSQRQVSTAQVRMRATAYVWLLARMPATRVASHAYVNPLVAVALGYFVAGEEITPRMIFAAALVVASVFLILKPPSVTGGSN